MINLRYHIVSLVAVFLALGLGILMGSTVIDQGIVSQLSDRTKRLAERADQLRAENDTIGRELDLWDSFAAATVPGLIRGRLTGRRAVLVVVEGTKPAAVDGIAQALADAGASVAGRVTLTEGWQLRNASTRDRLESALDVTDRSDDELLRIAAERLAGRLGQTREPSGDLLIALRDAQFIGLDAAGGGDFPPSGAMVVVVASGLKEHAGMNERALVPLLRALAPARRVSVAEPLASADSLADRVRSDSDLRRRISTVDDADIALGRLALIFGLRSLVAQGNPSHYGARQSATSIVPPSIVR